MAQPVGIIQSMSNGAKPIGTIGPAPQQLRAGTGSVMGDIKQDAANIFLPERFAAEIAQKQNPGSEIYQDDQGNWILRRADGSEHYLNEPGLGYQDALNVTGAMGASGALAVPGMVLRGVGAVAPWLSNAAGRAAIVVDKPLRALQGAAASNPLIAGMTAGGTYATGQQGVGAALTDQPMSLMEVGEGAVFGGVVPGAQKYGGKLLDVAANVTGVEAIRNPIKAALYGIERIRTGSGQLTQTAKEALEAAGIKWQNFTPEQIDLANSKTADVLGMNTKAQGRAAGMATIGIDEPTPGMLSQRPDAIRDEALGLNRRARETSIRQLQEAGDALGRPDNLDSLGNRLVNMHNQQQAAVNQSFDAARRSGEVVKVPQDALDLLRESMTATLKRDLSADQLDEVMSKFPTNPKPKASPIVGANGRQLAPSGLQGPDDPGMQTLRSLFEWRRGHLGVDGTGKAKKAFDDEMSRWLDQNLATDLSADAIKAFQRANREMREFSQVWRSSDTIEKLITKDKQGAALRIDPEAAANTLWNASETGFITRPGLRRDVRKLKELLNEGLPEGQVSPEFQALADSLAYKALKLRTGFKEGQRQGSLEVNGTAMKNHWDRVRRESGDLLDEIYPPGTLDAFDNFIEYARMMDTKLKTEASIPLDQAPQLFAHLFKRLGNATFRFSRAAFQEASDRAQEVGANKALREFYGELYLPRGTGTPLIAAGEATEAAWTEVYDDLLRVLGYDIPGGPEPLQIPIINGVPQP